MRIYVKTLKIDIGSHRQHNDHQNHPATHDMQIKPHNILIWLVKSLLKSLQIKST